MQRHGAWRRSIGLAAALCAFAARADGAVEEIQAGASPPAAPAVRVSGYVDVGLARAENGGRGFIFDTRNQFAAQFPGVAWIVLGDPWSTAINSRGEPAETAGSFSFQADPVASAGALTFLVNELDLDFSAAPLPSLFVFASVDLMPRTGSRGSLGDFFDVDYAYVDWTPLDGVDLTLSAGKLDPAFGREYRLQESPDRPGIVPSLLFRYVGGHPVGVKARARFFDHRLVAALAVANGPSFIETMSFSDDVDRNDLKTASGRVSSLLPLPFGLGGSLDLGLSGEAGAQGRQIDSALIQWQWGADALLQLSSLNLELRGEFVRGIAPGGGVDGADSLNYRAFDVEAFWRVLPALALLGRYEQRHALQRNTNFVYLVHIQRLVAGLRFDPVPNVAVKLEYVLNGELEPLPSFPNDVITSSLVVSF